MKFNNTNKAIELGTRANEARRTRGDGEGRLAQAYNKSINEESMGKDGEDEDVAAAAAAEY